MGMNRIESIVVITGEQLDTYDADGTFSCHVERILYSRHRVIHCQPPHLQVELELICPPLRMKSIMTDDPTRRHDCGSRANLLGW